jgi:hypothetical protein
LNERLMRERIGIAWRLSVFTDYQKSILIETTYYCYSNNNDESIHPVFEDAIDFHGRKKPAAGGFNENRALGAGKIHGNTQKPMGLRRAA